jgi:hypothetical protein
MQISRAIPWRGFDAVYSRPDYPYNNNLHGLFYYNHIWPQIAMLFDYLISDTFVQSQSKIDFPHEFVPAYAYLKSRVYGNNPGKFYNDNNVNLWMPKQYAEYKQRTDKLLLAVMETAIFMLPCSIRVINR